MISSRYEDTGGNSEIAKILDRIAYEYSRGASPQKNTCCKISLNGAVYVKSYKEFMNIVESCRVAFVLITTTYCPYCRLFKPIFYRVAEQYGNKAAFIEVNADYIPEIAMMFDVYSTPTTIVLIDGKVADGILGYVPISYFREYVNDVLSNIKCVQS